MNEAELDFAISENLERGFFEQSSPGRYRVTTRGERHVELLQVRASMPALADLLGVLTTAAPEGEIFSAALQELKASMPWDDWPGLTFVSGQSADSES